MLMLLWLDASACLMVVGQHLVNKTKVLPKVDPNAFLKSHLIDVDYNFLWYLL